MSKTIQEQIEVMQHYANGGEVEYFDKKWKEWTIASTPNFNWAKIDYRIKEQKKTITIEKWLMKTGDRKSFFIVEGDKSYLENYNSQAEKVRLLEAYEVEV